MNSMLDIIIGSKNNIKLKEYSEDIDGVNIELDGNRGEEVVIILITDKGLYETKREIYESKLRIEYTEFREVTDLKQKVW